MRITITLTLLCCIYATLITAASSSSPSTTSPNHELLSKIGLTRIRGPNSHHRKRLAVESRHHSRSDDSHMFIIKLPPNPHYYAHNRPNSVADLPPSSKNVPVGFKGNGKPGKIYHWNIPTIKKIVAQKLKSRLNDHHHHHQGGKIDIHRPDDWNEVLDKPEKKERKPLKPSYYVPSKPKKESFKKYFSGNGKPHAFYVIEKNKKAHYHRLLP